MERLPVLQETDVTNLRS